MTAPAEPTCTQTPDGTYVFETQAADGRRLVAVVLPEEVDEIAGPLQADPPPPEERRRRQRVARLLAEDDLRAQADGRPESYGPPPGTPDG